MTVSFVIQTPSRNYTPADMRPRIPRGKSLRFTEKKLARDGVAAADAGEHFHNASRMRSTAFDVVAEFSSLTH
jgi:hypothetical protein